MKKVKDNKNNNKNKGGNNNNNDSKRNRTRITGKRSRRVTFVNRGKLSISDADSDDDEPQGKRLKLAQEKATDPFKFGIGMGVLTQDLDVINKAVADKKKKQLMRNKKDRLADKCIKLQARVDALLKEMKQEDQDEKKEDNGNGPNDYCGVGMGILGHGQPGAARRLVPVPPKVGDNDNSRDDVLAGGLFGWDSGNVSDDSRITIAPGSGKHKIVIKREKGKPRDPVKHGVFDAFNNGDMGNVGKEKVAVADRNQSLEILKFELCDCCGLVQGVCEGLEWRKF